MWRQEEPASLASPCKSGRVAVYAGMRARVVPMIMSSPLQAAELPLAVAFITMPGPGDDDDEEDETPIGDPDDDDDFDEEEEDEDEDTLWTRMTCASRC